MKLLTKEQQKQYHNAKVCYICKEKIENKRAKYIVKLKIKCYKWDKVRDTCLG